MRKHKIEWTDMTWNPVWGCLTGCEYCYANYKVRPLRWRKIYNKEIDYLINYYECVPGCRNFKSYRWAWFRNEEKKLCENLKNFKPQWLETNFQRKFPKKPKRIFVNSMSDIHWWKPEWMERVLERIREYPQHSFQFLTKFPRFPDGGYLKYEFPENCWLGVTITNNTEFRKLREIQDVRYKGMKNLIFASIEPIYSDMKGLDYFLKKWRKSFAVLNWVIVGAETGHRKERVIPQWEWIASIELYCLDNNIPLFQKDNFQKYMKERFICVNNTSIYTDELIQQFPGGGGG